jgi:hypothetical protein
VKIRAEIEAVAGSGDVLRICGRRLLKRVGVPVWFGVWAVALLVAWAGLVATAPVFAATGHGFSSGLTQAGGSALVAPVAVAVDRATGRVFVADVGAGVVDVYDGSGVYVGQFGGGVLDAVGVAIDEASGDVYVADPFLEAVLVYRPDGSGGYAFLSRWWGTGTPGKEFGRVVGVAVDNSEGPSGEDVYVVEPSAPGAEGGAIDIYKPKPNPPEGGEGEEGVFVRRLSGGKLEAPNGIAVDCAGGRVLVADSVKGAVLAYGPEGVFEEKLSGKGSPYGSFKSNEELGNVAAVGVDAATGDVYVAEVQRGVVSQYSQSGVWEGWITGTPSGDLSEPAGVVVGGEGHVFVADRGAGVVDRFGPGVLVPDVVTKNAPKAKLTRISAVLSGTINGDGEPANYRFQYGETEALGTETETQALGTAGEATVASEVMGLQAGKTYFFRIGGENENGSNVGVIREFTTLPAVEGVATGPATGLEPEAATVTGTLTPGGVDAHYYFQWGTTTGYQHTAPLPPGTDAGSGTEAVQAEASMTGLVPNTTYHYRLVAQNSYGVTYGQDLVFTTPGPPRITVEPVSAVSQASATLHAQVNPDQLEARYRFEYGQTTGYESRSAGTSIGSGATFQPVETTLEHLKAGVTYHYRAVAENIAGVTMGSDETFTTVSSALITSWASELGPTGATLNATIDPLGNDTTYYFQYGTAVCHVHPGACSTSPAPPGLDIGAGGEPVAVSVKLTGLTPGTIYHYRVVAINTLGESTGSEHTLTTPEPVSTFALPDGRAWEMVSPPEKGSAPVEAITREGGLILAATNGESLTYVANGAIGEEVAGNRNPELQQIIATRGAASWSSQDIVTPNSSAKGWFIGNGSEYRYFTPELTVALDEPVSHSSNGEPPLVPGVTQATIYLRNNATGAFLPLVSEANTAPGTQFGGKIRFVDATPDLSNVVLVSKVALTGGRSNKGLYEWTGGQLQYVSLLPNGKSSANAELGFNGRLLEHAISEDGSRVIWTAPEGGVEVTRGHLYMRDSIRGETIRLDAAQGVAEPAKGSAQFQIASSDGSRVFFTDKQRLTPDATAEPGQGVGKPDLYECEIGDEGGKLACSLNDLTVDPNEGEHANVQTLILGTGENGTDVYLVAQGVLASNRNGNSETAQSGGDNLYHLHYDGTQWHTTFIATLSSEDSPEWEGNTIFDLAYLTARVSPNGRYLAFMSQAPITGYDNVDVNPAANGARDEEVYLYDSLTTDLTCVSCNPTGARPAGVLDQRVAGEGIGLLVDRKRVWAPPGNERWLAGNIPGWTSQDLVSALFQSRYLSSSGRLFFNSPDHLVPAAANGKENVYEYEPTGVGSCQSASGGCVALISSGTSERESAFIEATPGGSNVFFLTEAKLLPQDTDTAFDIYDARTCTELSPCLTVPAPPGEGCAGAQTCRPASPVVPAPAGPAGSASFSGPGNPTAPAAKSQTKAATKSKPATKRLTRKQKLAKAVQRCRRKHPRSKHRRKACELHARKRYGPEKTRKAKHAAHTNARSHRHRRSGR